MASRLQVEPYRLVSWQRRWYLVARDAHTDAWAPYRVDWMQLRVPGGRRFTPSRPARRGLHRVRAPRGRRSPAGRCTPGSRWTRRPRRCWPGSTRRSASSRAVDDDHCVLVTGGDSVEISRGLHRHARPRLHRDRAARTCRPPGDARQALHQRRPAGRARMASAIIFHRVSEP